MFNDKFVLELLTGGVLQLLQWLDFKDALYYVDMI
jgi:hypothetical protein